MRKTKALLLAVTMLLSLAGCVEMTKEVSQTKTETSAESTEDVTFDIRPQDDYYGYINAQQLWNEEIEYGSETYGAFASCENEVKEEQKVLFQNIIESDEEFEPGSPQQLIRDYYYQYISDKQDYTAEFDKAFSLIDAAETPDDIVKLGGQFISEYGVNFLFSMRLDANYYNNNEYSIIFKEPTTFFDSKDFKEKDNTKIQVRDTLRNYLTGFGIDYNEAEKRADKMIYYFTDCLNAVDFDAINDDEKLLNIYSKEKLGGLLSNLSLNTFESAYGFSKYKYNSDYIVYYPELISVINSYITEDNMQMWKDIAKCHFVMEYESIAPASYLSYEPTEKNMPEDEIISEILRYMSQEIGELYYYEYYTDEYKNAMKKFEADIKKAYVEMINNSEWLSEEGKSLMTKKFNNIKFHFGGQEKYEHSPSDANLIGKNIFETKTNFIKKKYNDKIKQIGTVPDFDKWGMLPQEINAYYNPSANAIYVTRGIMHSPFYDINGNYYTNLGGLGSVICHELSHAFDSHGILVNADGNYAPEWISQADRDAFEIVKQKTVEFYDGRTLLDVYHVNGRNTLAENLADLGAVQCILQIPDNDEDKIKIFENYAKIWHSLYMNDYVIASLTKDEHSPDLVRVNSVIMNMDDFQRIFDVQEGDGMYVAPENRVKRW